MSDSHPLHKLYLFKDLNPAELGEVAKLVVSANFSPGDEIFSTGDEAHSLYMIKHGSVKIQKTGSHASSIEVATLGTGSHFGEISFVDGEKRSATVVATETSEILSIEFDKLKKLIDSNSAIAVKVYRALALFCCGRLRVTTNDLSFAREKNLRHF